LLRTAVSGAAAALLATALAAVIYSVIEFREFTLAVILFAPVLQSAVIGALAAVGFNLVSTRLRGPPFVALAAGCGCLLGALVGVLFVGHSPHFSHDKAVAVLASSWFIVALASSLIYVLSPNNSLQRP
jgi:hypothetical protein